MAYLTKRRVWQAARLLLIAYLLVIVLMMFLEESLLYFPTKYPDGDWNPPGLVFEDAWFQAADGARLHGWFVPCDHPRAVALFAHGNAGNLSHRADLFIQLHRLGIAVLAFDYRGYGRSSGVPTESGIIADGRAARTWLAQRAGIPESEIVLMGESLGGAVAVQLAAESPARGLVLENTFTSAPDVAAFHYPWLPVKQLMRTRFDSAAAIGKYHGPLLQFHGDADTIVPFALGRKLFDAANQPKQWVVIPGSDHNDPRTPAFFQALDQFIANLPSTEPKAR
ncbi:MAG TPA: alpha/beta hydrolase [Pirellulales bacterium]|nr:alpha/beta hydrolase [Pirellulales bacterium]